MPSVSVLIVDDEEDIRDLCSETLQELGYLVDTAGSVQEALRLLSEAPRDIVLSDISMPEASGLHLLEEVREHFRQTDVILMSGHATVENAIGALRLGAYDYIKKPFALEELASRVERLAERKEISLENQLLREQLRTGRGPGGLVGNSAAMQDLYRMIVRVAQRPQPALILGESGTGKELVARAIHESGPTARHPFVAVDCAALSSTLMESELFGHTAGAFTGASQRRVGLLASAGAGVVFFDEIGELPLEMQAKLLRVIQQRELRPLGSNQPQRFDARIVAATHRNLAVLVKEGRFREDLYFRLNVLPVHPPPLRDRREDIPALAVSFIQQEQESGGGIAGIAPDAMKALCGYSWPGNVRELRNYVERAIAVSDGPLIELSDLPVELRCRSAQPDADAAVGKLEAAERQAIVEALETTQGRRLEAAKLLGIGKTTLYKKLKDYGLRDDG